jgi:hypothetical protein
MKPGFEICSERFWWGRDHAGAPRSQMAQVSADCQLGAAVTLNPWNFLVRGFTVNVPIIAR